MTPIGSIAGFSANWVAYCLHAELVWNVDMSDEEYDALYDRLLRTFYGDAAPLMREYLDVLSSTEEHGQCVACWMGLLPGGRRTDLPPARPGMFTGKRGL